MESSGLFNNTSFKFNDSYPDVLAEYIEDGELYNQSNLLFLEEKYMEECSHFLYIIDKLKKKVFDDNLYVFIDNSIKKTHDYSKEFYLYKQVIMNNNINGLYKSDLAISINHFEVYKDSDRVKFVKLIYILIFLSCSTDFNEDIFVFRINFDDREVILSLDFREILTLDLSAIYNWIIDSNENVNTRLKIIRELILRKHSFSLTYKDLESAKSTFNRVIKEETDKYFAQINMLKNDFLTLSEQKRESLASLHLKLLAWGSSIALFVYGELENIESNNLIKRLLFSKSEKGLLFIIIFIVSILVIWLFFKKEVNESKDEYCKLKEFYTQKLFFEESDFSNFITLPEIPLIYDCTFWIIFLILIIRLIFIFI